MPTARCWCRQALVSGKTRVIIERVLHLVDIGVVPESILCMTFTEKATDEMSQRLHDQKVDGVTVNTMHAMCLEMLKENSPTTGITEKTAMFSDIATVAWCVRNIGKFGIDPDVINLETGRAHQCSKMLQAIRGAKREMISAEDLEGYVDAAAPANSAEQKKNAQLAELAKVYRAYEAHKKENDLIDYDDMVVMAVEHLNRDDSMLEEYRKRYRHVLVDEFQDNNYAQFLLATLLAGEGGITAVGDGDQSIMGFQGAFGGIFEEFGMKYPNGKSVTLDQNYRCTKKHIRTVLATSARRRGTGRQGRFMPSGTAASPWWCQLLQTRLQSRSLSPRPYLIWACRTARWLFCATPTSPARTLHPPSWPAASPAWWLAQAG